MVLRHFAKEFLVKVLRNQLLHIAILWYKPTDNMNFMILVVRCNKWEFCIQLAELSGSYYAVLPVTESFFLVDSSKPFLWLPDLTAKATVLSP